MRTSYSGHFHAAHIQQEDIKAILWPVPQLVFLLLSLLVMMMLFFYSLFLT